MKKRFYLTSLLCFFTGVVAFAQGDLAKDYFNAGELKVAKDLFEKQKSQSPAESNYYLGEIAYIGGDQAKAKEYYTAGLQASADYVLNNVGLGKVLLPTDAKAAENEFSVALKKNKKDVVVLLAIAKAYDVNNMADKATKKVEEARKANKKDPAVYIYQGDKYRDTKEIGKAAAEYAQAYNFDPKNALAYIKSAQIYLDAGSPTAIDDLKKVLELNPNYLVAYKYLGKVYSQRGEYGNAIDAYKNYFSTGEYDVEDLTLYAAALYFTQQYDQAKELLAEGMSKDPNNFVLNRLLMYSYADADDFEKGLTAAEKFFSLDKGKREYLAQDFIYYGEVLSENNQTDKALEQYKKAIEIDPTKTDLYKEISTICSNSGDVVSAAQFLEKYIELIGEQAQATDHFELGRLYYRAGTGIIKENKEEGTALLKSADKAFEKVTEQASNSYLGYFWRGHANASLDPETTQGLAKPYYEKVAQILEEKADGKNDKELLDAYRYLSYYHYLKFYENKSAEDKSKVKEYGEKMLKLDPTNDAAKQLIDAVK